METKINVGNISFDTTAESVRERFATCGEVSDVQLTSDRWGGERSASAVVTMATEAAAEEAVSRLHGADLEGRRLHVKPVVRVRAEPGRERAGVRRGVKIAQQFRERGNMTYDLDCAGTPLTVRIFRAEGEQWRVEARTSDAADAVITEASAASPRGALDEVARSWRERAGTMGLATFDWEAIAEVMTAVRAV